MNFAIAFEAAMKAKRLSQYDVAAQSGIHQTGISRFVRGDLPLPANLTKILSVFAGDKVLRRQLTNAYLRDILDESGVSPEEVCIRTEGSTNLADRVDAELYGAITAIAESAKQNAEARAMVLHMAHLLDSRQTPMAAPTSGPRRASLAAAAKKAPRAPRAAERAG